MAQINTVVGRAWTFYLYTTYEGFDALSVNPSNPNGEKWGTKLEYWNAAGVYTSELFPNIKRELLGIDFAQVNDTTHAYRGLCLLTIASPHRTNSGSYRDAFCEWHTRKISQFICEVSWAFGCTHFCC